MANKKIVKEWFKYAIEDLKAAKRTLDFGTEFKRIAAFHAQQCAEKAAKGYLTSIEIRAPKTHDLELLAKLIQPHSSKIAKLILSAEAMTDYAVAYRYPDAQKKQVSLSKAKQAVVKAQKIYDICYEVVYDLKFNG